MGPQDKPSWPYGEKVADWDKARELAANTALGKTRRTSYAQPMSQYSDRALAMQMLAIRERGYTFGNIFRVSAKKLVPIALGEVVLIVGSLAVDLPNVALILTGMLIGAMLREFAWLRAGGKVWPFREKITDWDKVRELAEA